MNKFNRLVAGALALAAGALPASADESSQAPKAPCAFVGQIDNFKEIDDFSAIIETSPNRRYKVTFLNSCRQMRWALFARVEARPGICLSEGDQIVVGRLGFADRCMIETVEALPAKAGLAARSN
jgi:hypothetical protein